MHNIVAFLVFLSITGVVFSQFNMSAYNKMPPLYNFDLFDECQGNYCLVYAEIISNQNSSLWIEIEEISSKQKQHYRHDQLFFGVCMEKCKELYSSLKEDDFLKYQIDVIANNNEIANKELVALYDKIHQQTKHQHNKYINYINVCLNQNFQLKYNLNLRASLEYCVEPKNENFQHDALDIMVYIIFTALLILNVMSTIYDFRLNRLQTLSSPNVSFYRRKLPNPSHKLFTSFSILRNYYRIVGHSETVEDEGRQTQNSQLDSDLCFIDAFRVCSVFFVILAHTILMYMAAPIQNPQFFEQLFYRAETAIFQNGAVIIQIFFIISGFLLYIKFQTRKLVTNDMSIRNCFIMYFKILLYRYLRILPSLLAIILFNATILVRLQNGPFWLHTNAAERAFCRSFWWQNVLLINNYLMKESCVHQTWYLAADMQLFELFLILLILVTKLPKLKKFIFWCVLILAIFIPASITYIYRLEAVYHSSPESYRYLYFKNAETFYKAYTPFYTNLSGYLFGITLAYIFLHSPSRVKDHIKSHLAYKIGWWLIFPLAFALLFFADFVVVGKFPTIVVAIFAGIYRTLWVLICCMALLGMCFKLGWIALDFARLKIFHMFSRISYQSFLWHVVVLRLLSGYVRQPIYINRFYLISQVLLTFVTTHIFAFFWALFFEYPIAEFVKYILKKLGNCI